MKQEALTAIQADHDEATKIGWNDGGTGRQAVMVAFKEQVRNHQPGQRVLIEHKGLFVTMADGH